MNELTDLSVDSLIDPKTCKETWHDFGENLRKYITTHKEYLDNESYDVILGFSRGGAILALTFACLLKDSDSTIYSKLSKASVRSIPKGLVPKGNHPCFVMDHPASRPEKEDIIKYLENDLRRFSKRYNQRKPLNVLIIDDNLTGATRVKFLDSILFDLEKKGLVKKHRTLAYVRHRAFLKKEIPTIRDFPEDKDIFVMPWHRVHGKKDLKWKDKDHDASSLIFSIELKCDTEELINEIKEDYGFEEGFIINGASNFLILNNPQREGKFIELIHFTNKFYPPKKCLEIREYEFVHNGNRFYPLCSYNIDGDALGNISRISPEDIDFWHFSVPAPNGLSLAYYMDLTTQYMDRKTMGVCLACSCLNCNRRLFDKILSKAKGETISIKSDFNNNNILKLAQIIKKWFADYTPKINMEIDG